MIKPLCFNHGHKISIEERFRYARMTREQAMNLSPEEKVRFFYSLRVRHRNLEIVEKEISRYIGGSTDTRIFTLIGPPGTGKTSFAEIVLANRLNSTVLGQRPFIMVSTPAHGSNKVPWSEMYTKILKAGGEPLIECKRVTDISGETVRVRSNSVGSLKSLRDAVQSMLTNRGTLILALDEVLHMLRFGNPEALMDTFKSLADDTSCQILLIGSYDLFELATAYGQVTRRGDVFYLGRYGHNVTAKNKPDDEANRIDILEFRKIIEKLQRLWPLELVPQFVDIAEELTGIMLGVVGLLKEFLTQCLVLQVQNKGKWDPGFVARAMKKPYVLRKIRGEIELGERRMRRAGFFDDPCKSSIASELRVVKVEGVAR